MQKNVTIASKRRGAVLYLSKQAPRAVRIACENFLNDLHKVCGCRVRLAEEARGANILVGVIGEDAAVDGLVSGQYEELRDEEGAVRREAYVQTLLSDGRLVIAGSGRRGAIYGVYDISRRFGVSPWYDLADVPVRKRARAALPAGYKKADWPCVQYRGIFLNDEEELGAWAKLHTPDGTIGPSLYRRIFELILRLKGNYIWPAMHVNAFNADPENGRLAEEMGVVVGTSHCDMLLRSNQHEFDPWVKKKGYQGLRYDYSVPENRERLKEYWRESVEQNAGYEVCYTLGMRGIHDSGFCTRAIDEDGSLSEEEKRAALVRLLEEVIRDQREIIRGVLGNARPDEALQVFIPYKEVLPLYDAGLRLPDDVTVMWTNDNFGHVRRYPDARERARRGGHALYFHSSYWAPPPLSYLFINSIPLAQTGAELRKAYREGIRKIWVDNVGALKPREQDAEFFLQFAWDAGREEAPVHRVHEYLADWFNEQFSGGHGEECARIYESYAQITNVCKAEHLYRGAFSQTAYGDEGGRRVNILHSLYTRVCRLHDAFPVRERDAFFELLGMKVCASYFINAAFYYAERSRLCFAGGKMQSADEYLRLSRLMTGCKRQMLHFYNERMAGGKWKGILTPEAFPPPASCLYPDAKPALRIGETGMGVALWNEEKSLTFDEEGIPVKWLEIFNKGCGSFRFSIATDCDFLAFSETEGEVRGEVRVLVTCLKKPHGGHIVVTSDRGEQIVVPVAAAPDLCKSFSAESMRALPEDGFLRVEGLDRMRGACMEAERAGARLERAFRQPVCGSCTVEVTRYLTLNSTGRIRFRVILDGEVRELESFATDEWRGDWFSAVRDNGEKLRCRFENVAAGEHTLAIEAGDRYVTFGRVSLYFGDAPIKECHLGPEPIESAEYENIPAVCERELLRDTRRRFGIAAEDVPPVALTYAGHGYWNYDRLYLPNEARPQSFAPPRYAFAAGEKKDVVSLFGAGVFAEQEQKLALEAEYALEESRFAWRTADASGKLWGHLQAETDGGSGLAMYVEQAGLFWEQGGPAMHYRCRFSGGKYYVWLLTRFDDGSSDACAVGVDGAMQPRSAQYGGGSFFTYSSQFLWVWTLLCELEIPAGEHVFTVEAVKSGLRIDRIYLTKGKELPPCDASFAAAKREI